MGVVGAGTLGTGVVQAGLLAGSPVTLLVRGGEDKVARGRAAVTAAVERDVARGRLTGGQAREALGRLRVTTDPAALATAGVVVESVPEDVAAKLRVIATVEAHVAADCLIASTTSGIPAATLAVGARHPERIVVAHYVWPAHRMPLVEVAVHPRTSSDARNRLTRLLASQGKQELRVADRPGFLITRARFAYWDAAVGLVCEGQDPATVDAVLEEYGWPLGPFRVIDAAGLRTSVRIFEWLAPSLGHRFGAFAHLRGVVDHGFDGFYRRGDGGRRPDDALTAYLHAFGSGPPAGDSRTIVGRVMGALADELRLAVADGVAPSWEAASRGYAQAFGFPAAADGLAAWSVVQTGAQEEPCLS
jgi:3-hydroxyacyl-CoA dehydrogenase/enoyl-CoA hydratase/3-hydroxybutyryl-CoA epimerase